MRTFLLLAALLFHTGLATALECDLHYQVTPRYDTTPRRLDVVLTFPAEGQSDGVLRIAPSWAGVSDFGASLQNWKGQSADVKIQNTDDSFRWKISHPADGLVRVAYEVRAHLSNPDDGTAQQLDQLFRVQIGKDWFQFFGHAALLSVERWDDRPGRLCVAISQPADQIGPLLGSHFATRDQREAAVQLQGSNALLSHAFYAGGPGWRVQERQLSSGPIYTAMRGSFKLDENVLADKTASLLDAHRRFWGDLKSPPQQVIVTPSFSKSYGGTLVHQAAVLHASEDFGPTHAGFESLIAHENLHQWLPRRLGRSGGGDAVSAAKHYWLSEGFTTYYTHRLLLAAGLWTLPRYADQVTRELRGYWRSPARNATADSIAPRFFSDRDAGRQMYSRGEILAMRWDLALRERGRGAGLDAIVRSLLLPVGDGTGVAHERVLQALTAELGDMPNQDVATLINEGRELPLDETLAGPCFTLRWEDLPRWVLGFDTRSFARREAIGVVPEGPAYKAGLRDGMTLLNWSVQAGDVSQDVVLQVKAEQGLQELRYRPVDGMERVPTLAERAGAQTHAACRAWLNR